MILRTEVPSIPMGNRESGESQYHVAGSSAPMQSLLDLRVPLTNDGRVTMEGYHLMTFKLYHESTLLQSTVGPGSNYGMNAYP